LRLCPYPPLISRNYFQVILIHPFGLIDPSITPDNHSVNLLPLQKSERFLYSHGNTCRCVGIGSDACFCYECNTDDFVGICVIEWIENMMKMLFLNLPVSFVGSRSRNCHIVCFKKCKKSLLMKWRSNSNHLRFPKCIFARGKDISSSIDDEIMQSLTFEIPSHLIHGISFNNSAKIKVLIWGESDDMISHAKCIKIQIDWMGLLFKHSVLEILEISNLIEIYERIKIPTGFVKKLF